MEIVNLPLNRQWQYAAYFALSIIALIFTIILLPSSGAYFRRFYGDMNAIVVVVMVSIAGAAALWVLQSKFEFEILRKGMTLRGIALSAVLATLLAVAIVIADNIIRYPQDINVPVPQALLFYPVMGFVVEIVFFVLPLCLLLLALNLLAGHLGREKVVWLAILIVATLEPTFQVLFGGQAFTWGTAYTWIHIFVIALLQLYIFWRYDFMSMYMFRVFYYAYWHILWGVLRLKLLF